MASDPKNPPDVNPESESVVDPDDDTVIDPHDKPYDYQPYDEAVEKPLKDSENFIPSEEL